jgi:hypothetical protein
MAEVLTVKNPRGTALRRFLAIATLFAANLVSANLFLQAGRVFSGIYAEFEIALPTFSQTVLGFISTNGVVTAGFAIAIGELAVLLWLMKSPGTMEHLMEVMILFWILLFICYAIVLMAAMLPMVEAETTALWHMASDKNQPYCFTKAASDCAADC